MAKLLWGKVYYKNDFAGYLREEPGDRVTFTYDESYLNAGLPAIAYTLPLQSSAHTNPHGLHPFFDNLVSEGWLEQAQTRLLGRRIVSRFELLLAFGFDCAGAVSVVDPDPSDLSKAMLDVSDAREMATLTSRASLSGVQPKLALRLHEGRYYPTRINELSTHIAKFPSPGHEDLVINEYLTTRALRALLPDDDCVELDIQEIQGLNERALVVKRFDRDGSNRFHFEEFNQLLGLPSRSKYHGAYRDMSDFIHSCEYCMPSQTYILYRRILAGILLGNTDMHLKNFALFHGSGRYQLTPSYDQVAAALYQYKTLALAIHGAKDMNLGDLKAKNIIGLGEEFKLPKAAITMAIQELSARLEKAKEAIAGATHGTELIKDNIINLMEKRWNGTYDLIGQSLSTRP